ncbi:MAG: threonine synthase [Melioribacteraceae bacterium]
MKYYSTRDKNNVVSFKTALMEGLSKDGGLFMPQSIPLFPSSLIAEIDKYSFIEMNYKIAINFIGDEIPPNELFSIVANSVNFPAPLVELTEQFTILELFHGPTLAFKDFGARFMAKTMEYFARGSDREINILVATSGDTGSAVANGFYGIEGIKVYLLYPTGKVSFIQEKQLTTLDKNITAIEVYGTFDDCQKLVKEAFMDEELNEKLNLSSANSINIARLIPQTFYYFNSFSNLKEKKKQMIISVPSGNLGNLTAGIFAARMGIPISALIAATNKNNVFTEFIRTLKFNPRNSVQTISNAMDVGNPSNLERLVELYRGDIGKIRNDVFSFSFDDEATLAGISELYERFNYTIDPHGAVGYLALKQFMNSRPNEKFTGIVFETAHPAKFNDSVQKATGKKVEIPQRLAASVEKKKKSIPLSNSYADLKELLLGR